MRGCTAFDISAYDYKATVMYNDTPKIDITDERSLIEAGI